MLTRLLERRFGPLPAWAIAKIEAARRDDLELWTLKVLEAHDLDNVFA